MSDAALRYLDRLGAYTFGFSAGALTVYWIVADLPPWWMWVALVVVLNASSLASAIYERRPAR